MASRVAPIKLVCPYCGGELYGLLTSERGRHESHEVFDGMECETTRCSASWDRNGEPRMVPLDRG